MNQRSILLFFVLISKSQTHTPKNTSDVIVTYEGHAEAENGYQHVPETVSEHATAVPVTEIEAVASTHYVPKHEFVTENDEVLFVPNERGPPERSDDDYISNDDVRIDNLYSGRRTVDDLMGGGFRVETESPVNSDILFVNGKNYDTDDDDDRPHKRKKNTESAKRTDTKKLKVYDCKNLDCNKTSSPICGGRTENNKWKYRLFLNECFFRKVNCAFRFDSNKYTIVALIKCEKVGAHYDMRKQNPYMPAPPRANLKNQEDDYNPRRSFSSRRSTNMNMDGQFCSHACPFACPDDYDPECAVSVTGNRRVFANHCKLDQNSCAFGVVWHRRPLAECVGQQMADFRQNRAFIGWMQRIGIIDGKGRLTSE